MSPQEHPEDDDLEDDEVPPNFQGRVAYIAKMVLGIEQSKDETAALLGLHGLLYNLEAELSLAAGHIHVGFGLPVDAPSSCSRRRSRS